MRRARQLAGILAAVVLLLTAGCSQNPGVVAYVGPDQIASRELDAAMQGVQQALGSQGTVSRAAVIDAMIRGQIARQIAAKRNIVITDTDREALFKGDQTGEALLANPEAKKVAFDLADEQIVAKQIGTAEYVKEVKATDVRLNPRYGKWNPDAVGTAGGVQNESTSLSVPSQT